MKAVGGFFELELQQKSEYHIGAYKLNSGRSALRVILRAGEYKKVYVPHFCCSAVYEALDAESVPFEKYSLNSRLEPIFSFTRLEANEAVLFVNYFGLNAENINSIVKENARFLNSIIIDNSQAFFELPIEGTSTFYSARKFFGVADGGYLYSHLPIEMPDATSHSYDNISHLIKRIDLSAEEAYNDFLISEENLGKAQILKMSIFTHHLLCSIDYNEVADKRLSNYQYLADSLEPRRRVSFQPLRPPKAPLCFPYFSKDHTLRMKLAQERVYIAKYWPNVLESCAMDTIEYQLSADILALPIDQRLGFKELDFIISKIKHHEHQGKNRYT